MYNTFGYSLQPPVLNEWKDDFSFQVNLDPDLSYMVDMTDPKLQLALGKPSIIPRTIFSLKHSDGFLGIYFKVDNYTFWQGHNIIILILGISENCSR